jgi:hypothetical protein
MFLRGMVDQDFPTQKLENPLNIQKSSIFKS